MLTSYYNRHLWVRLFGWLLIAKDVRRHPLLFSQRAGLRAGVPIGWLYLSARRCAG